VVIANTFAGREIECDGKILRIMEQSSVQAVVSE
jgi:co-chaperonin GroES (HSP10)